MLVGGNALLCSGKNNKSHKEGFKNKKGFQNKTRDTRYDTRFLGDLQFKFFGVSLF